MFFIHRQDFRTLCSVVLDLKYVVLSFKFLDIFICSDVFTWNSFIIQTWYFWVKTRQTVHLHTNRCKIACICMHMPANVSKYMLLHAWRCQIGMHVHAYACLYCILHTKRCYALCNIFATHLQHICTSRIIRNKSAFLVENGLIL